MPLVYMIVIFGVLIVIGLFWFLQSNQSYRTGYEFPPIYNKETNAQDLLLLTGLRKIDLFSDRGKWLLFLSVFLVLVEIFILIAYAIRTGARFSATGVQHVYVLGGIIYFFLVILSIFLALRLTSTARELPHLSDRLSWPKAMWEQKLAELTNEQRQHLSYFILEKSYLLEQSYSLILMLVSSASTLLLVWLSHWFINVVL